MVFQWKCLAKDLGSGVTFCLYRHLTKLLQEMARDVIVNPPVLAIVILLVFYRTQDSGFVEGQVPIQLIFRGVSYSNNSVLSLNDVGNFSTGSAIFCTTELSSCCQNSFLGHWYYPDGSVVPNSGAGEDFYRGRHANQSITLSRRNNAQSPTGSFCCELPDSSHVNHTLCVTLVNLVNVSISPSGLTTIGETYSLTCSASVEGTSVAPSLQWLGPDGMTAVTSSDSLNITSPSLTSTRLQFDPLQSSHEGNYTCTVTVGTVTEMRSIQVNANLEQSKSGAGVAIIGGVVGGIVVLLVMSILLLLIILCVVLSLQCRHKKNSSSVVASNTADCIEQPLSEDPRNKKQTLETSAASNPIYWVTESENLTTTKDSTIYDQPQLELTQSVRRNNAEPPRAMHETVNVPLESESTCTAAAKEVVQNSTYSVVMKDNILDTPTSTDIEEQGKEDGSQQPDATIFDCAEYESPGVPATSGYSVLNHSKAIVDPTTPTTQGTMNGTTTGEGYSTLHQNTNMEANSHPQNTLHPSSGGALIYHYAAVDSHVHHPTIKSSTIEGTPGYVNTIGPITPEALDYYDLGQ